MSNELNNYLLDTEDQEWKDHVVKNRSAIRDKALLMLGLLVELGAAAGAAGNANADELLLCTYNDPNVGNLAGTIVDDPVSDKDQLIQPDPWTPLQLDEAVSQKVYKGYILKPIDEYVEGGTANWRIFKKINGQDVQVGILDGMGGQGIGLMTDSGVFFSGGKLYKVTDTGDTLVSQEIGDLPLPGVGGMANIGGYIFANYTDGGKEILAAFNEQEVLSHVPGSGSIPIASLRDITPPKVTNEWSLGMDVDQSTNELIIPQKQGVTSIDFTAFLDKDGQLPPDFSLADVEVGEFQDLGVSTVGTLASNGYRYHGIAGGAGIIMQTPTGQTITVDKEQLNGETGVKLSTMYELIHGGIYIIFNNDFDDPSPVPPVVLHESGEITVDPGDMTPFIKKCFVIPEEYQDMFAPVADPCADVACPQPAEQCKQSAGCDANTGNCLIENKPDETSCDDGNPNTSDDKCVAGACEGTLVVNPEPDTVEPSPEAEPDVVEQAPDIAETDTDVVEQEPDTVEPDVVEQGSDTVESEVEPESDVAEQAPDTVESDSKDLQGETGKDTQGEDAQSEADLQADLQAEIQPETQDDSVPGTDSTEIEVDADQPGGKTPNCSCDVSDTTQRQQRGVKEAAVAFGLAALAVLGPRRRKEKTE